MNDPKCQLIVKASLKIKALRLFEGTTVEIVDGLRGLGSVLGNEKAYENFNLTTAGEYSNLKTLGQVAKISPQNAYACITTGFQQKLNFVSRTTPNSRNILDSEANIQPHVLPSFFDSPVSQNARRLVFATNQGGQT